MEASLEGVQWEEVRWEAPELYGPTTLLRCCFAEFFLLAHLEFLDVGPVLFPLQPFCRDVEIMLFHGLIHLL